MMEFTTPLEKYESSVTGGYHIKVPNEIAAQFIEGKNRRVVCTLNEKVQIQAALLPIKGFWHIIVNGANRAKLGLMLGEVVLVKLEKDTSEYGLEFPEELEAVFAEDEQAFEYFNSYTKGKQRTLIYIVGKVKNTNSRMMKALAIAEHLVEVKGELDFKKLNETIKKYNQRLKRI